MILIRFFENKHRYAYLFKMQMKKLARLVIKRKNKKKKNFFITGLF